MAAAKSESILGVAVRDAGRLSRITQTVVKHGFGEFIARSPLGLRFKTESKEADTTTPAPVRFRMMLEDLGPTFIKLGQILSMRPDLMPPAYIEALGELQDNAPVLPFEDIREVIEESLGESVDDLFEYFKPEPLATASIGQTHRARTHEGDEVVVKVQRPGIAPTMRADLNLLYLGAKIIEATIEEAQLASPSEIAHEFEKGLLQELNFANELNNIVTAQGFLDPDRKIKVPKAFPKLSSARVLTMSFSPGVPIRKLTPESPEAKAAVEEMLHGAAKQVFIDGFFHADPHAGNILYEGEGEICMIDLGLMGHLTPEQRHDMVTLALAAITNDTSTLASILLKMGTPTERVNLAELKAEIVRIRSQQLDVGSFGEYDSSAFVQEFVAAASRFKIRLAPEYSMLTKAAATIEGIVKLLDPQADIVGIARPYAEQILADRFSPEALLKGAMGEAAGMSNRLKAMPDLMDQLIHDVSMGTVQIRPVTPTLDLLPRLVDRVGARMAMALFALAMTIAASVVLVAERDVFIEEFFAYFTVIAAILGWTLTWWMHLIGPGKQIRVLPLVKFFKR